MARKLLFGTVVKNSSDKTISVLVTRTEKHFKCLKIVKKHKKYLVHDPLNFYHAGDSVSIVESKPISKRKRWLVLYNSGSLETLPKKLNTGKIS